MDFAFVQNKAGIAAEVRSGQLPKTARVYVFKGGTIANFHYVALPYNARNQAGAMVLANLLLDPKLQLKKLSGDMWGDGLAINPARVSKAYQARVGQTLRPGSYTLDPVQLSKNAIGDVPAEYDQRVQNGFKDRFLR